MRDAVRRALGEDGAFRDATAPVVGKARIRGARIVARENLVVSGLKVAAETFRQVGARLTPKTGDGRRLKRRGTLAVVSGPATAVLAGERTALNFLQRLSGIATLTSAFVAKARPAKVFDTRKTTPGLRVLEKEAVRHGGGNNHRLGLADGAMVKDNHIATVGDLEVLRERVYALAARGKPIVMEAGTLEEALIFSTLPIDVLMLDNFSVAALRKAVKLVRGVHPGLPIEASGGVTLRSIGRIARTGVDRISVGAITHSAPAVDIALDL